MKKASILLGLALLTACGPDEGTDGYAIAYQEYNQRRLTVDFVDYANEVSFKAAASKRGLDKDQVLAFSHIDKERGKCEIHIVDPVLMYKPELIGHEIAHCRYGRFHD